MQSNAGALSEAFSGMVADLPRILASLLITDHPRLVAVERRCRGRAGALIATAVAGEGQGAIPCVRRAKTTKTRWIWSWITSDICYTHLLQERSWGMSDEAQLGMGSDWLGLLGVILTTLKRTVEVFWCKIEEGDDEYSSTSGEVVFLMNNMILV